MARTINGILVKTLVACFIALGVCLVFGGQAHAAQGLARADIASGALSTQAADDKIYVSGIEITSANASDVLRDGGSVKYSFGSQTLTLTNANIKNGRMSGDNVLESISYRLSGGTLTIKLVGKNTISAPKTSTAPKYAFGIADWTSNNAKLKLTGNGSLTVRAAGASYNSQAISVWKGMVVQGKVKLSCYGGTSTQKSTGIEVMGGLKVKGNAKITAVGETGAFTKAPKFSGYTPKVNAGYSSKSIQVNKKKPAASTYTKYAYVKIVKAAGSGKSAGKKPGKVNVTGITPLSGGYNIYWTKMTKNCAGFELQTAENASFKPAFTYELVGNNATGTGMRSMANGTTYYVRMRAYNKVGGKKVFGAWSPVRIVVPRATLGAA